MSLSISYIPPKKQFFFNVKDARNVERGIGGYYKADTTAVSTTSTTGIGNLKVYSFTASAYTNTIRVRIYAHVSGAANGSTVSLTIDSTNVANAKITATSSTLAIDYTGNITSNANHTVYVGGAAESGYTLYIDAVYIIAGFGLTSTTSTSILTITLNTAGTDSYVLNATGNFVYKMGVRWWIVGNRKTTAAASFSSTLANETQSIAYYATGAIDDGNNNTFIVIRTGDYPGDNGSFTISGNVGASGDTIIITGIYAQVILRGNIKDSYNNWNGWFLLIREKGVVNWAQELLSIDGGSYYNLVYAISKNSPKLIYQSSSTGTDLTSAFTFPSNDSPEIALNINYADDPQGKVYCPYVNVIVI